MTKIPRKQEKDIVMGVSMLRSLLLIIVIMIIISSIGYNLPFIEVEDMEEFCRKEGMNLTDYKSNLGVYFVECNYTKKYYDFDCAFSPSCLEKGKWGECLAYEDKKNCQVGGSV